MAHAASTKSALKSARFPLYVLSDSTGNLPRHMLTAFLTQFPAKTFAPVFKPFLQTPEKLDAALAAITHGAVMHAFVTSSAKDAIKTYCNTHGLACCDLTGQFVDFLSKASGVAPSEDSSGLHRVDETYRQRIRAMEFTLEHDDGLGLETLHKADIVLTGVSRTSKTPTSIYLAQQGYRTANVSLAMEVDPPEELLKMKKCVVALIINPNKLAEIRARRLRKEWKMQETEYSDLEHVREEITWSRRLFMKHDWPILDVTDFAIEETAARVVEIIEEQKRK